MLLYMQLHLSKNKTILLCVLIVKRIRSRRQSFSGYKFIILYRIKFSLQYTKYINI